MFQWWLIENRHTAAGFFRWNERRHGVEILELEDRWFVCSFVGSDKVSTERTFRMSRAHGRVKKIFNCMTLWRTLQDRFFVLKEPFSRGNNESLKCGVVTYLWCFTVAISLIVKTCHEKTPYKYKTIMAVLLSHDGRHSKPTWWLRLGNKERKESFKTKEKVIMLGRREESEGQKEWSIEGRDVVHDAEEKLSVS